MNGNCSSGATKALFLFLLCALVVLMPTGSRAAEKPAAIAARLDSQWSTAFRTHELDKVLAMYTPDTVFLRPDASKYIGQDQLRALLVKANAAWTIDFTFRPLMVRRSGDLLLDVGDYDEVLVRMSNNTKYWWGGTYLTVYKRQKDGTWLIQAQSWTDRGEKPSTTPPPNTKTLGIIYLTPSRF